MSRFKKYKKAYKSYAKTAIISALFLLVAIPFVNRISSDGKTYTPDARYMVVLNGEEMGYVSDATIAENALLSARTQLGTNTDGLALVEADLEVIKKNDGGAVLTETEIAENILDSLSTNVVDTAVEESIAYTVRIDDFTVTMASLDDVSKLLNKVRSKYVSSDSFKVEITSEDNDAYTSYKAEFVSDGNAGNIVSIGFVENIEILETKMSQADIISVDDAYEMITKEHTEKGTYTIKAGDCLSAIARDYNITLDELLAMNYGFTVDTAIFEGDVIVVAVPASEISVKVVEKKAYDESYNADVQYVDNPGLYIGNENVIQQGSSGLRSVVANVTSINGTESSREILEESITKEAVPTIIERGTLTPPTYLKPITGGMVTQGWGYRTAPLVGMHNGVDWYVPIGTAVRASSTGVVTMAGWYGNYGYCVDIQHSDGSKTRYGHLSSIAVAYGQTVLQGQVIAYSGSTGFSTGPHLHFEIWINGASVNPLAYVQ